MQVDPIKPTLKAPGTRRLNLKCEEPHSDFAFNFKSRRYTMAPGGERVTCVSETGPVALLQSGYHVDDGKFVPFSGGCHCAPVIAVDVCFGSFPLAVTAAADRTARLWHLEERRCMAGAYTRPLFSST